MANNAEKEEEESKKEADVKPDQHQKSLDTQQGTDEPEEEIEHLEVFSDVNEETFLGDEIDKIEVLDIVAADLKEDKASVLSKQSLKDGEIPIAALHQVSKPTPRLGPLSLILFGILSGAVGFIAAYLIFFLGIFSLGSRPEDIRVSLNKVIASNTEYVESLDTAVQRQEVDIEQLVKKIEILGVQVSSNLQTAEAQAPLRRRIQKLENQLNSIGLNAHNMTKRIVALENRPFGEIVSESFIGEYKDEVKALQFSIQAQRDQVERLIAEASAKEMEALEISQNTMARIALVEVQSLLKKGMPFVTELNKFTNLTGESVPRELNELANTGILTIFELSAQFPLFARKALMAERAGTSETGPIAGWVDFLKFQFQARSVVPKEGSDADAILSRAEDAVRQGNLAKALEELSRLTSPAGDEMVKWSNQARALVTATDAVKLLLSSMQE